MRLLIFVVGILASTISISADLPQTVGVGSTSCSSWNKIKSKPEYEFYAVVWLQGFISGVNTSEYLSKGRLRNIHGKEYSYYANALSSFCGSPKNAHRSLSSVAMDILLASEEIAPQ
ncbi:hypothetical protein ACNKU7_18040 [Microbulbifer sp. SA54]|uniref:hypothetical protein n=1 Tax=Microbulbifer sp. SA54 TaxID=3401577 RepID=UPI003AAE62F8